MFLMNLLKSFMSPLSLYTWETCRVVTYISSVAYESRCNDSRESNDDGLKSFWGKVKMLTLGENGGENLVGESRALACGFVTVWPTELSNMSN